MLIDSQTLILKKNTAMAARKWTSIKEYKDIKFEFFEGIAKITINIPKVYNAFRPETNMEMLEAMNICRERNDISVVVLTGLATKLSVRVEIKM